jgi:transcription initiation factor TFIID subunit 6
MKTLLLALVAQGKSRGTREGAIRGLVGVGKEAIRKGLIEGGGAKVVGSECNSPEYAPLVDTVLVCPSLLLTFPLFQGLTSVLGRIRDTASTV